MSRPGSWRKPDRAAMVRSLLHLSALIAALRAQSCLAAGTWSVVDGAPALVAAAMAGALAAILFARWHANRKAAPIDPARAWSVLSDLREGVIATDADGK